MALFFRISVVHLFSIFALGLLLGCATANSNTSGLDPQIAKEENLVCTPRDQFPPQWFAEITDSNAPSWEILPQAAGPCEVILSKRNELGILSNFASTPFIYRGVRYPSIEGFWQSMKYPEDSEDERAADPSIVWPFTREQVSQMTGFEAKRAGDIGSENMKKLGIDWVTFEKEKFDYKPVMPGRHYQIIKEAMWEKLQQNIEVRNILLATKDLILKPDHLQSPKDPAAWRYFEIWMEIRTKLLSR